MKAKLFSISVLFSFIFLIQCHYTQAQKFSISVLGGYNLPPFGSVIGESYSSNQSTSTDKNVFGSYGQSVSYGIGLGYKICNHVTANLYATMLYGKKITVQNSSTDDFNNVIESDIATVQNNFIRLSPGLIFTFDEDKKFQPFVKTELIFGLAARANAEETTTTTAGENDVEDLKFTGGTDIGFGASLGAYYKLSTHVFILADINGMFENHGYTKGEVTKETNNGVDQLPGLNTNEKQTIFKNEIDTNSQTTYDPNSPDVELKQYLPFNSIGFEVGIKFVF